MSAQSRLEKLKAEIAERKRLKQLSLNKTQADAEKLGSPRKPRITETAENKDAEQLESPHKPTRTRDKEAKTNKTKLKKKRKKTDSNDNTVQSPSILGDSFTDGDNVKDENEEDNADKAKDDPDAEDRKDEIEEEEGDEEAEEEDTDPNAIGGFSVLGNFSHDYVRPVKRKLPDWLATPTIIGGALKKRRYDKDLNEKEEDDNMWILDDQLRRKLHDSGIDRLFPVQREFIPELWKDVRYSLTAGRYGLRPRDICVSAPTGSGKTLAYTLPIIQCLKQRMVPHVRAVVVLPVRDLAEQVYQVFSHYCADTPLKVGIVVGKTVFNVEQDTLVKKRYGGVYHSVIDILVATPGRLVDHINSTPGFDLSHLRFLVIDEADRMMENIKLDWLSVVETAAYTPNPQAYFPLKRSQPGALSADSADCVQMPLQKLLFSATLSHNPEKLERLNLFMPRLMTSVISSAPTLRTNSDSQHASADSHQASNDSPHASRQVSTDSHKASDDSSVTVKDTGDSLEKDDTDQAQNTAEQGDGEFVGKYTTPEGLTEYIVESDSSEKPLMVLHFLHNLKFRSVLCFTNSVETTHRLCLLVKQYGGLKVKEFSSRLPGERRKKILKQFSKGKIDLLVCSDAMARGMDVDNVKYVISYDNPPYIKTYIHRVGRTARAGRAGIAISLLEKKEFFHFKQMMREAGKWKRIKEMKLGRQALKPLVPQFQAALAQLPQIIKGEKKKTHPKQ